MVLKNDPRKVLELFNKPVDVDEDEFLDQIDANKSFSSMPDKPAENSNLSGVKGITNEEQAKLLDTIADEEVDEESLEQPPRQLPPSVAAELTDKQKRFFALFRNTLNERDIQAAVPDALDLAAVKKVMKTKELPEVHDTPEEKEAKLEDLARRAAYLALQQKAEKDEKYKSCHDLYVANFHDYYKKND